MRTLLIDSEGIGYPAMYAMKNVDLTNEEGLRTEIIYVFLQRLATIATVLQSNKLVFLWDTKRKDNLRKKVCPTYKEKRHKNKSELEMQMLNICREQLERLRLVILPAMGFKNIFMEKGFEADDLMASIVMRNDGNFVMVTGDTDMYQCLSLNVSQYDPDPRRLNHITIDSFMREYGIHPKQWRMVKCLAGCQTDEVEGIKGVGITRAIQYIKNEIPDHHKIYSEIKDNADAVIRRNYPLVVLPFVGCPDVHLKQDEISIGRFHRIFTQFNFDSFLTPERWTEWRGAFKLG